MGTKTKHTDTDAPVRAQVGGASLIAMSVRMTASDYGPPHPTITIMAGSHHRHDSAAAHRLAAEIEDATPRSEGWIVQIDSDRFDVYLELLHADAAEAARGMAILEAVADAHTFPPIITVGTRTYHRTGKRGTRRSDGKASAEYADSADARVWLGADGWARGE